MFKYQKNGFTLIELSIVLVIIGLIVGGVLLGRDLIKSAEIKKTITEMQNFQIAVNTFKIKYNCMPGDCQDASNLLSGAINGDGDGLIECQAGNGTEGINAFHQLSLAGLISGVNRSPANENDVVAGVTVPISSFNNGIYLIKNVQSADPTTNVFSWDAQLLTTSTPVNSNWVLLGKYNSTDPRLQDPIMTTYDTFFIDSKIDDGMPATGNFGSGGVNWAYRCLSNHGDSTSSYYLTEIGIVCTPIIKIY